MEPDLPPGTVVLGVDEHTACLLDLDMRTATVLGRGAVTVRRQGASTAFASGSVLSLDELSAAGVAETASAAESFTPGTGGVPSLRSAATRVEQDFEQALARRDVAAGVAAALELEQVLFDWAADTEADDVELARAALRSMMVRLGAVAEVGVRDPREPLVPLVEALVELRDEARAERSWVTADRLRDRLTAAGVEVRDTPAGTDWLFRGDAAVPSRRPARCGARRSGAAARPAAGAGPQGRRASGRAARRRSRDR